MGFKKHGIQTALLVTLLLNAFVLLQDCVLAAEKKLTIKSAKNLTVMIKAEFDDHIPRQGAGVIFSTSSSRLYIITANHVVAKGGKNPDKISVQFHYLPGEVYPAKLLQRLDKNVDLAVLSIDLTKNSIDTRSLQFNILGDKKSIQRGEGTFPVGYPGGRAWDVPPKPDMVWEVVRDEIHFDSDHIDTGSSGGGLFNTQWQLIGIITEDSPPRGTAITLQSIKELLEYKNYPFQLTSPLRVYIKQNNIKNYIPRGL